MMKKNFKKFLFIVAVLFVLLMVNSDLFEFRYDWAFPSEFHADTEVRGDFPVGEYILLRPGTYRLTVDGEMTQPDHFSLGGFSLEDSDGNILYSSPFADASLAEPYEFRLQKGGKTRVVVHYDPAAGDLLLRAFSLSSNHVLTEDSLLRHGTLSLAVLFLSVLLALRCFAPDRVESRFPNFRETEMTLLLILAASLLSCLAFGDPSKMMDGDDLSFHLARIEGIAADFRAGIFPPKIYLNWMNDYGVGAGFYYPDLFLYIPALMRLLGFTLFTAYRFFNFLCSVAAGFAMYACAKRFAGNNRTIGRLAAVLYLWAPYRLICMIYRCALGEVQAFIFFPVAALGLYEILVGDRSKWKLLTLGFWGLLCTHLVSLAIAGALCVVTLFLTLPLALKRRTVLGDLLKAAGLTIALGAFFLFPLAEQSAKNTLRINEIIYYESTSFSWKNLMRFKDLFRFFDSWEFLDDHAKPYPGWTLLFALPLWGYLFFRKKEHEKLFSGLLFGGTFLLFAATDAFPWRFFSWFLLKIQFSWRLLFPASFLLILSLALAAERLERKVLNIGLCAGALVSMLPMQSAAYQIHSLPLQYLDPAYKQLDGYEYTPRGADWAYTDLHRDNVLTEYPETEIVSQKRSGLSYTFAFQNAPDGKTEHFAVPLLAYSSYEAVLSDAFGFERNLHAEQNENGVISVSVNGVPQGTIRVAFQPTWIQRGGEIISLLSLIGLLVIKSLRKVCIINRGSVSKPSETVGQ